MTLFRCKRCSADPQPQSFGTPRKCAFDDAGAFIADNWNCATLGRLRSHCDQQRADADEDDFVSVTASGFDQTAYLISTYGVLDGDAAHIVIALRTYKTRGQVTRADRCYDDDGEWEPLCLREAEDAIERLGENGWSLDEDKDCDGPYVAPTAEGLYAAMRKRQSRTIVIGGRAPTRDSVPFFPAIAGWWGVRGGELVFFDADSIR